MRVVVIGGGIIGLSTAVVLADTLARDGDTTSEIVLFDPAPASGASHFAGGMLAPAAEVMYQQDPLFPLMMESSRRYPELLDIVRSHTNLDIGHRNEGTLVVAADRADAQHLSELLEYQQCHGMSVEQISIRAARVLEPSLAPHLSGAVSITSDTQISPRIFTAALIDAAQNLGVRILKETAQSITQSTEGLGKVVSTDSGSYMCEQVVIANGLGAASIAGWHETATETSTPLNLRPVYGDILRLRVPDYLYPLINHVVRGFVEDRPIYIIPRNDHTIALGATTREDGRDTPLAGGVYDLLRDGIHVVPGIEDCELIEASTGARPGTPDDLPYLGRIDDSTIVSTGYFRHGILLSALAAFTTVDMLLGRSETIDLSACNPLRHLSNM